MSTLAFHAAPRPQSPAPLERLAYSVAELAQTFGYSQPLVRARFVRRSCPFVPISDNRTIVLAGDHWVLQPWAMRTGERHADGPTELRQALQGRGLIPLREAAAALAVSEITLRRAAISDGRTLDHRFHATGIDSDELLSWVLLRRVAARWEVSRG